MDMADSQYQSHIVFDDLNYYVSFYRSLADAVFPWVSTGTSTICSVDTYMYSSMQGTLESIRMILADGKINDAYALLRKFYDSAIISIYSSLYLQEHACIENVIVDEINNWIIGTRKLEKYEGMLEFIRKTSHVRPITKLIEKGKRYKSLRDRCNDHIHYNLYRYVLLNDGKIFNPNRQSILDQFLVDVRDIVIMHVAYTFFINDHYMMSSDYRDSLECGMTPESDSQYWVATCVQDLFDRIVTKHRPDVARVIKQHTSMHLSVDIS